MSDKVINYLSQIVDLTSGNLTFSYILLAETNNEEVQSEIKKLIK